MAPEPRPRDTGAPRVGEPSAEYRAVCVFAPHPGAPDCGKPATIHVAVESTEWGRVSLAACNRHVGVARAAGDVLGEHPHVGWCGLPGTVWAADWSCCLLDGSGPDRSSASAAPAPATAVR